MADWFNAYTAALCVIVCPSAVYEVPLIAVIASKPGLSNVSGLGTIYLKVSECIRPLT